MLPVRTVAAVAVLSLLALGGLACHLLGLGLGLLSTPALFYLFVLVLGRGGVLLSRARGRPIWSVPHFAPYPGTFPAWEDSQDTRRFPWVGRIEEGFSTIKEELLDHITAKGEFKPQDGMLSDPGRWKCVMLLPNDSPAGSRARFPGTCRLLESLPGISSFSFLRLEGKGRVKPHSGATDGYLRCHLGITIPGGLPATAMEVAGEPRAWEEGKILIFNDAYHHTAYNGTDQPRDILLFELVRPEFQGEAEQIDAGMKQISEILLSLEAAPLPLKPLWGVVFVLSAVLANWRRGPR